MPSYGLTLTLTLTLTLIGRRGRMPSYGRRWWSKVRALLSVWILQNGG